MALFGGNVAVKDQRAEPREEVFYRTRARRPNGMTAALQIVNVSANGFMARTEEELEVGHKLYLKLPVVGAVTAEIRWSLGGRIGCQFDEMIGLVSYLDMLTELVRGTR